MGPTPGIDCRIVRALGFTPFMAFSMAASTAFSSKKLYEFLFRSIDDVLQRIELREDNRCRGTVIAAERLLFFVKELQFTEFEIHV
jgi:hypothetical protein